MSEEEIESNRAGYDIRFPAVRRYRVTVALKTWWVCHNEQAVLRIHPCHKKATKSGSSSVQYLPERLFGCSARLRVLLTRSKAGLYTGAQLYVLIRGSTRGGP